MTILNNISDFTQKTDSKKHKSSYRRKSYGSIKSFKGYLSNNAKYLNYGKNYFYSRARNNRLNGYSTIMNDSTDKNVTGEFSYGTKGSKFPQTVKISTFDEEKAKIYSPGPAKYDPKTKRNSTTFSFGKQKKQCFVDNVKKVPSPGRYKIKRDFVTKQVMR